MAYSEREDIDFIFGAANVTAWATRSDDDEDDDIEARITRAIAEADEEIDDFIRTTHHIIPLTTAAGAVPVTIRSLSARMAGVRLYEAMGVVDYRTDQGVARHRLSWHWDYCQTVLDEIRNGKRKINAV